MKSQTMDYLKDVANHYTINDLTELIAAGIEQLGMSRDTISIDELAAVDEFHIGGREATRVFLDQMQISDNLQCLDIGCGLGGAARFAAKTFGCRVTGIDLTEEFTETGNRLTTWVGMQQKVQLETGSALDMPFPDHKFDRAVWLHVGMNIADKLRLCEEAWRVLKPGGLLGIYDVMRVGTGDLAFPVPWASQSDTSSVGTPQHYKNALDATGFELIYEKNRSDDALAFFERMTANSSQGSRPPLGLHLLLGMDGPTKVRNMVENTQNGLIAPVEMVAKKSE